MPRKGSYLTVRQAAEMVHISRNLIYRAIADGQMPCVVIHAAIHLERSDAWVELRRALVRAER